jgi:hypothetical protein
MRQQLMFREFKNEASQHSSQITTAFMMYCKLVWKHITAVQAFLDEQIILREHLQKV